MLSLRNRLLFYVFIMASLPFLIGGICYVWFQESRDAHTAYEQLRNAEVFFRVNEDQKWTDDLLKKGQAVRSKLDDKDLQLVFSNWLQARSENGDKLIHLRTEELTSHLAARTLFFNSLAGYQVERFTWLAMVTASILAFLSFSFWRAIQDRIFRRLKELDSEVSNFRISEHQMRIHDLSTEDEITTIMRSFLRMIDNLFTDLNYDLGLNRADKQSPNAIKLVKEQVQNFLYIRRSDRDRRQEDINVDDERRNLQRRQSS